MGLDDDETLKAFITVFDRNPVAGGAIHSRTASVKSRNSIMSPIRDKVDPRIAFRASHMPLATQPPKFVVMSHDSEQRSSRILCGEITLTPGESAISAEHAWRIIGLDLVMFTGMGPVEVTHSMSKDPTTEGFEKSLHWRPLWKTRNSLITSSNSAEIRSILAGEFEIEVPTHVPPTMVAQRINLEYNVTHVLFAKVLYETIPGTVKETIIAREIYLVRDAPSMAHAPTTVVAFAPGKGLHFGGELIVSLQYQIGKPATIMVEFKIVLPQSRIQTAQCEWIETVSVLVDGMWKEFSTEILNSPGTPINGAAHPQFTFDVPRSGIQADYYSSEFRIEHCMRVSVVYIPFGQDKLEMETVVARPCTFAHTHQLSEPASPSPTSPPLSIFATPVSSVKKKESASRLSPPKPPAAGYVDTSSKKASALLSTNTIFSRPKEETDETKRSSVLFSGPLIFSKKKDLELTNSSVSKSEPAIAKKRSTFFGKLMTKKSFTNEALATTPEKTPGFGVVNSSDGKPYGERKPAKMTGFGLLQPVDTVKTPSTTAVEPTATVFQKNSGFGVIKPHDEPPVSPISPSKTLSTTPLPLAVPSPTPTKSSGYSSAHADGTVDGASSRRVSVNETLASGVTSPINSVPTGKSAFLNAPHFDDTIPKRRVTFGESPRVSEVSTVGQRSSTVTAFTQSRSGSDSQFSDNSAERSQNNSGHRVMQADAKVSQAMLELLQVKGVDPDNAKVVYDFWPFSKREMLVISGNTLSIRHVELDYWAYGTNKSSHKEGWFPLSAIHKDFPQPKPRYLPDYEPPSPITHEPCAQNQVRHNDTKESPNVEQEEANVNQGLKQGYAIYRFSPRDTDELEIFPGDLVAVGELHNDGWAWGHNTRTQRKGWFPANILVAELGVQSQGNKTPKKETAFAPLTDARQDESPTSIKSSSNDQTPEGTLHALDNTKVIQDSTLLLSPDVMSPSTMNEGESKLNERDYDCGSVAEKSIPSVNIFYPSRTYKQINFSTGQTYFAMCHYVPLEEDELKINYGDRILICSQDDEGWAFGENLETCQHGDFPIMILSETD